MSISRRQRKNKALRILRLRRDAAKDMETKNRLIEAIATMLVIGNKSAVQAKALLSEKSLKAGPNKVNKI